MTLERQDLRIHGAACPKLPDRLIPIFVSPSTGAFGEDGKCVNVCELTIFELVIFCIVSILSALFVLDFLISIDPFFPGVPDTH